LLPNRPVFTRDTKSLITNPPNRNNRGLPTFAIRVSYLGKPMSDTPFRTVFAVYPDMTQLDFTGPYQVLCRLPHSETLVASLTGGTISAEGLSFADTIPLAEIESCDLICVPGGRQVTETANNRDFLAQINRLGSKARYVTSVCTGSILLGAAGLLKNKRAACHWAWRDLLPLFSAIPDAGRVVRDGNVITGGGVTAGIDFALTVFAEIAGVEAAQEIQLAYEYAPAPPFDAGRPETAPVDVLNGYRRKLAPLMVQRHTEAVAASRIAASFQKVLS
jgi:cyclohexyl-isocyanide hydratase